MAGANSRRHERKRLLLREAQAGRLPLKVLEGAWSGEFIGLGDAERNRSDRKKETKTEQSGDRQNWRVSQRGNPAAEGKPSASQAETGWDDPDWLYCRDGKWRPVESGTFPLAHGLSARVGRLRAYGNAIVPQAAAEVMIATMERKDDE